MVIVIVGPTAVGKTKMSIALAKALNGEIVNADSTQVYKGLDIATAKITEEEKENIPHHLFDFKEITENYTVYDYQKDCRNKIEEILKKGKTPIIVGGTGLYIKAALYDYKFTEGTSNEQYENIETSKLFNKLLEIDPNTEIHPNNRKRIIRAINSYKETGQIPSLKEKTNQLLYDCKFIGLTCNRDILYERINKRTDMMLEQGLLKEAKELFDANIRSKAVLTPIGYKELFSYFEGTCSLEEAIERIKQNSRKYAKRQYTWFNHQMPVEWFSVNFKNFAITVQEVLSFLA